MADLAPPIPTTPEIEAALSRLETLLSPYSPWSCRLKSAAQTNIDGDMESEQDLPFSFA